mmetsp:Transcript_31698/g.61869  ORF Transcript_31698/g.61869 Transcript_31698/m.61869 type:complete len:230 (-) Transcript_31698:535-1224(-)
MVGRLCNVRPVIKRHQRKQRNHRSVQRGKILGHQSFPSIVERNTVVVGLGVAFEIHIIKQMCCCDSEDENEEGQHYNKVRHVLHSGHDSSRDTLDRYRLEHHLEGPQKTKPANRTEPRLRCGDVNQEVYEEKKSQSEVGNSLPRFQPWTSRPDPNQQDIHEVNEKNKTVNNPGRDTHRRVELVRQKVVGVLVCDGLQGGHQQVQTHTELQKGLGGRRLVKEICLHSPWF